MKTEPNDASRSWLVNIEGERTCFSTASTDFLFSSCSCSFIFSNSKILISSCLCSSSVSLSRDSRGERNCKAESIGRWVYRKICRVWSRDLKRKKTSFSFFRLSSRARTTDRYCSTVEFAVFSCSANSVLCSSALRRRPFSSDCSCSDWLGCWDAAGPGERTATQRGSRTKRKPMEWYFRSTVHLSYQRPSIPLSGTRRPAALVTGAEVLLEDVVASAKEAEASWAFNAATCCSELRRSSLVFCWSVFWVSSCFFASNSWACENGRKVLFT